MKYVTLGWDRLPTIVIDGGYVLPRKAELIIHAKYYPNWPEETWPVDSVTNEKLPIESRGDEVLQRYSSRNNRRSSKGLGESIWQMVQTLFRR
jgi:hypothetical protein